MKHGCCIFGPSASKSIDRLPVLQLQPRHDRKTSRRIQLGERACRSFAHIRIAVFERDIL